MFQEDFGADVDNRPQLSLSQPVKKKIKPHLPAESVGKRYVERFWHPFGAIVAPSLVEGAKPAWRTIDYYLQPSQLWKLHQDKSKLVGLRFDNTTRYATIDLDFCGDYHNIESINRIKAALEDIGIVDIVILQSSFSGGYHLILNFASPLPTFAVACALEITLRNAGFILRQGHLEIFPNTKPYSAKQITNYKAIRCPMQPGSGSFLLDDDLQPISDSVSIFLDYCDRAASRQDLTKLKRVANKAKKQIARERYRKQESADAAQWRANWEEIIAIGWTGQGQTNTLLQIFAGYGIVFLDLRGDKLVEFCLSTAINAPGYKQYCRHQHEIEARVRHWVGCTIRNKWYSAYVSYPERLLGTFANTFAEAIAGVSRIDQPKDNVISFDRRHQQNWERSQQAQRRIQIVVTAIEWDSGLPGGATERAKAIRAEYKRRFNKTISQETLQKHLHLWHPTRYILDPWAENSLNPYQSSENGQFYEFQSSFVKHDTQNPCGISNYVHSFYMKVFCLPPAATAPQGLESAEEVAQPDVSQSDSALIQSVENLEFINSFNTAEINSNQTSNQLENSVYTNILQLNGLSSHQDFIYPCSSGTSSKVDNQNLSNTGNNGLGVVSIPAAVAPESPQEVPPELPLQNANNGLQGASVGDETADVSYRIEELKRVTKLRLMALNQARAKVHQYRLITGRILSTQERDRLEQRAKMQFYLDSGNETLIAEAKEWATANPGCLPFSLELESEKFWER
ncbi:hypothetical protein H6G74_26710 [Nostoc spongiaeforme FACHB-130]|uniref:Replication protein n=1 Tax=Nostoc spongiaeforme FACHB-130 TaxID=1357510 RepID=A0ABR8G3U1_9NOSO|nr:hypothetical protein [Nostoc spongiaeforme]MBD2597887.1 hypothetical protein [Nostoc spongiaeforme FACHB-130]